MKYIGFKIDEKEKEYLKERAREDGRMVSSLLRKIVYKWVRDEEKKERDWDRKEEK